MATTYVSKAEEQAARRKRILAQAEAQKHFIPKPEHRDESFYNQWAFNHGMDIEDVLKFVKIYDEHLETIGDWEVALAKANEIWKAHSSSQKEENNSSLEEPESNPDNSDQKQESGPDNSSQEEESVTKSETEEQTEDPNETKLEKTPDNSSQTEEQTKTSTPPQTKATQPKASDNSSQKEEQKDNPKGKKYSRIVQNAKERTVQAPSPQKAYTPTFACISKEEREKGDTQLQKNLKALLENSTLMDVLIDHKDTIRDLKKRGYGDDIICKLFADSYKFERITPTDLECALNTSRRKKTA